MPGQQTNNQSNNQPANDAGYGASQGIQGYVSPYSNPMPPSLDDSQMQGLAPTQSQPAQPQQSTGNSDEPNLQEFMQNPNQTAPQQVTPTPVISTPPASPSDNLLDDQDQVNEILKDGQALQKPVVEAPAMATPPLQPVMPQPQIQTPQPVSQVQPTEVSTPTPQQKIEVEIPQAKVEITPKQGEVLNPMPQTSEPIKVKEPELPTVSNVQKPQPVPAQIKDEAPIPVLNPQQDLAKVSTKGELGVDKTRKFTKISDLLDIVINRGASDLHLTVGYAPFIRIDDKLVQVGAELTKEDVKTLIFQSLSQNQKELLEVNREVDLSYQHFDKGRFRINAYFESGTLAAAYRLIPTRIKTTTELNLPGILNDFTRLSQGLFLVTGPTGSGKSTTLAAMIQSINTTTPKHIITIEDPIEYIYPKATALVDQRELGSDTHDWTIAMKSALRQDPDVILIGELRDFETIQLAITLAETGHLVFATLHTSSAAQSIDRIIDVFPPHQQQQIKTQLAGVLKGILSQRLVPLIGGGRQAVTELLIVTPAVQNLIREGKTYQIDNVIATSADVGMLSLEKSLVKLVRQGKITTGTAQDYAIRPEEILKLMKTNQL